MCAKYLDLSKKPPLPVSLEEEKTNSRKKKESVYINEIDDERLTLLAEELKLSKSELIRRFASTGLEEVMRKRIAENKALEVKEKTTRGEQIERAYMRALLLSGDRVGTSSWEAV